jgi:hypothetical protein
MHSTFWEIIRVREHFNTLRKARSYKHSRKLCLNLKNDFQTIKKRSKADETTKNYDITINICNFTIQHQKWEKEHNDVVFDRFTSKKRVMINWHHSLIRWHHSSNTLTFASHIRKESFVKQKSLHFLHARCIRNALEVLQHKDFVDLLSWSNAFDSYKYNSKRAIFDVDYQVWNESFLKSWDFDVLDERALKK